MRVGTLLLTKFKAVGCCKNPSNYNFIYFTTESCKLQKQIGTLKSISLKSRATRKIHEDG